MATTKAKATTKKAVPTKAKTCAAPGCTNAPNSRRGYCTVFLAYRTKS